jgi:hypothetical protein
MATFNLFNWIIVLGVLVVVPALLVIPFWRILPRAGLPAPLSLVSIIPPGPLVLLWILAFKRWPGDR